MRHWAFPRMSEEPESTPSPFLGLGLCAPLVQALTELGYEEPTPIQRAAIPELLGGRDVLGQAATGTGKTAAFALPMLELLSRAPRDDHRPRALVLVPTRELAMQVSEAVHKYGKAQSARVLPIYGGQAMHPQLRALQRGVDVVVATPGRALDHLNRGTLDLSRVGLVVLDEADEMLDMGFAEDLEAILSGLPEAHQTALFSATLAPRILHIANSHLKNPVRIAIEAEQRAAGEMPRVRQAAYIVQRGHKAAALARVIDMEAPESAIVFCRTRVEVDELCEGMNAHGYRAEALHGGFAQDQRERVLKRFREGKTDLLVATDVAARGLDIKNLSHVVNYDVPTAPEAYVHRIGRTGRAGREGVAITLVEPREQRLLRNIQHATGQMVPIERLPTVADLRARRLELFKSSLVEALQAGELDPYQNMLAELAEEHEVMELAAAALKLAHEALHPKTEEAEIPTGKAPRPERGPREAPAARDDRGWARDERAPREERDGRPAAGPRAHGFDSARLFIGAGRIDNLRPGDLVGAIANEAGVPGDAIGAIRIAERFSLVEVPEEFADDVIGALSNTKIRGRRVQVRRDRLS